MNIQSSFYQSVNGRPVARIFRRGVTSMSNLHQHTRLSDLGACSPRKFFEIRCSEIASEVILGLKHSHTSYLPCRVMSIASNFLLSMYAFTFTKPADFEFSR